MRLGDGQAEDAEPGHLVDDLDRDQLVAQMPAMRVRHDPLVGKAAELVADHLELVVQPCGAEAGGALLLGQQPGQPHPRRVRVAVPDQPIGIRPEPVIGQADVLRPGHLALAHRDAAPELGQVLAETDLQDQPLGLAEGAGRQQPLGPEVELA